MKKMFLMVALFATCVFGTMAQTTYKRDGKTFTAQSSRGSSSTSKETEYLFTDSKGNTYPIWISKNGHCFVKKVSAKTGKSYNYQLSEELSREICNELKMEYIPSVKKTTK